MIDWERRRRNIKILCAANDKRPTQVANETGMSPNTLTKFLNANTEDQRTLSSKSLKKVIDYFGLTDEADLDTDNIISDPKQNLRRIIEGLSADQASQLLRELEHRFPASNQSRAGQK